MTSRRNLNKITVFDVQDVTNGESGGTEAEPHSPDTHANGHIPKQSMCTSQKLEKNKFFWQMCQQPAS